MTISFEDLYGQGGQEIVNTMYETLKSHSLTVSFDSSTKKFTILGSSDLESGFLEKIFEEKKYSGWEPQVLGETDELGNRIVQLKAIDYSKDSGIAIVACKIGGTASVSIHSVAVQNTYSKPEHF